MKSTLNKAIIFLLFVTIVLEVMNIYYSNKISTDSIYAQDVKEKINEFEKKNEAIQIEVLKHTSLSSIHARANNMGFEEPKEFVYLSSSLEIAVNSVSKTQALSH